MPRSAITLLIGLVALVLLAALCIWRHGPAIEADLTTRSLTKLNGAGFKDLHVTAEGRDLTVTGEVSSPAEQSKALGIVRDTYGVRVAHDGVQIDAGPGFDEITLTAVAKGQGIHLTGIAPAATVDVIKGATKRNLDDRGVEVAKLVAPSGIGAGMAASLPWLHRLMDARSVATVEQILLSGKTNRPAQAEGALLSLLDAAPDGYVSKVDFRPGRTFEPEELMAMVRPRGTGAVLSGIVASVAQRDAILAKAKELFKGPVHSSIMVANVEGADFLPGIGAGIPIVSALSNGRLQLTPLKFFLSGLTPEGVAFDTSQLASLKAALPVGAALEIDVTTPLTRQSCQADLNDRLEVENIQFTSAKADIKPASDSLLNAIASTLRRCPSSRLFIEGHTDSQGDDALNLDLSNRRSGAVYDRLIQLGMPSVRASAEGYGETKPVGDNTTDAGRAQNRRIEFRLEETTP